MLATLTALCLTTACRPTAAFEPLQQAQRPAAVTSAAGCATVGFHIVGDSTVAVTFPDSAACHTSLQLIQDGNPIYDRNDDRKVRIPVRVVNRGGEAVLLPVELLLAADSVTVLDPPGTTNNKIKLLNVDSVITAGEPWAGAEVWRIGVDSGTLESGDSTEKRRLRFKVNMPAVEGRLAFVAMAAAVAQDTSVPPVPNTKGFFRDFSLTVSRPGDTVNVLLRDVFYVRFKAGTSGTVIRSVLSRHRATIVGGSPSREEYAIRVPDPGSTWELYEAVWDSLNAEPSVDYAAPSSIRSAVELDGRWPAPRTDAGRGTLAFPDRRAAASQDTSKPLLPDSTLWPLVNPRLTSWPLNPEEQYYRDVLGIEFQPEASGAAINSFLVRFGGVVLGGFSVGDGDFYVVQVPNPGEYHAAVDSLVSLMSGDPAVKSVVTFSYQGKIDLRGPAPIDSGVAISGSAVVQDTSVPPVPNGADFVNDLTLTVTRPGDTVNVYFREAFYIRFKDGTPGSVIRDVFRRHNATIVGGIQSVQVYAIRVSDPGTTWEQYEAVWDGLNAEPSVKYAAPTGRSAMELDGRWPEDGAGAKRADCFAAPGTPHARRTRDSGDDEGRHSAGFPRARE